MPWHRDNDGLQFEGELHYDESSVKNLIEKLGESRAGKPAWICKRLMEVLSSGRAPKLTNQRFSKWCHYKGSKKAKDLAQSISRELFNGELCPRLLDSMDDPFPDATEI